MGDKICDGLKSVLTRVIDSADGYEESAKAAESGRFAAKFRQRANERRAFAGELRAEIARLGDDAGDDGSLLASAHRMFLELKAKMDDDDEAVLEEVVRGESALVETYEEALDDMPHGASSRSILERQLAKVRQNLADARITEEAVD